MSESIKNLTAQEFDDFISEGNVVIDFWAAWCGPCRMVAPVIDQLADEFQDKLVVAKVNVDDEGELATRFRIMSIPTIILFKDGEIAERLIGVRTKDEFKSVIDKYL